MNDDTNQRARDDVARDVFAVAMLSLVADRIPSDILELLLGGNPDRKIAPGALAKALAAAINFVMAQAVEICGAPEMLHVQFDGDHIRRWSREAFDGARTFAEIDNQPAQE
ncbi:hypothetical protein S2M10_29720 [Sphingomonas sp. S2M10]|uniref:hypothetical protein n=1 Tax=Sphingomonas sp. S2M10 TaxID=2705010 RepID=UPI0014576AFD|nr:hypothetical protein [Sphingomonas sp. S2M10]NLS27970.1 hypothetical protein [Sphingomonas sp. S2M10]